jgi:hypothetical protein
MDGWLKVLSVLPSVTVCAVPGVAVSTVVAQTATSAAARVR